MKEIGITTTVPIEILIAAGYKIKDLNNIFITDTNYSKYIDYAETEGFPKSSCAFKKGVYGVAVKHEFKEIIGVTEGDCSNTKALEEVLKMKGVRIYPFSYPQSHNLKDIKISIDNFMEVFGVTLEKVEFIRRRLFKTRELIKKIDYLTYIENKATSVENHVYQVSASDFNGNYEAFEWELIQKIKKIETREPIEKKIRLGYIGTPPMTLDLYDYVEKFDARFVYNEVQREFAFPRAVTCNNIYEQYYDYTYPYDINFRLNEIQKQIEERKIDAIIHYTQSFCYRQIEHIVIKNSINIPILNIEGDKLNVLDERTKLRLDAFLDMVIDLKEMRN